MVGNVHRGDGGPVVVNAAMVLRDSHRTKTSTAPVARVAACGRDTATTKHSLILSVVTPHWIRPTTECPVPDAYFSQTEDRKGHVEVRHERLVTGKGLGST